MSLAKDTILSAISSVIGLSSRMLVTILLARSLGPTQYGQFVFIQWVIELINLVSSFGMTGAILRFLPGLAIFDPATRTTLKRLAILVAASIIIGAVCFIIYLSLGQEAARAYWWVLILWFLVNSLTSFSNPFFQGIFRYDAVVMGSVVYAIIAPTLVLVVISFPVVRNAAMAITASGIISIGAAIVACVYFKPGAREIGVNRQTSVTTILQYASNLWIMNLVENLVWYRGEFGLLSLYASTREIALYSAALSLASIITQASGLLTGALTPHLVRYSATYEQEAVQAILINTTHAVIICASALALILIGVGPEFISVLLGPRYGDSYGLLAILAIAALSICSGCGNTILQIETNGRFGRNANIIALLILLSVASIATPRIGIIGAAVARGSAQTFVAFYIFWRLSRLSGYKLVAKRLAAAFCLSLFVLLCYYAADVAYGNHRAAMLLLSFVGMVAIYLGTNRVIGNRVPIDFFRDRVLQRDVRGPIR